MTNTTGPRISQDMAALDDLERRLYACRYAISVINSNGETIDPPKAAAGRGEALATLDEMSHELLCSNETGALLGRLGTSPVEFDGTRTAQVRVLERDRADALSVPAAEQADFTRLVCEASDVWHRAKLASDWAGFGPYVDRIVETMRRFAGYMDEGADPYDVWLDQFEHGSSRAFYDTFFSQVKDCVVPLVSTIRERGWQPSRACVEGTFDEGDQWALARDIARFEGLDMDALLITRTEHPFTDAVTSSHAIIAGHVYEDDLMSNVFSMLHEGGHALYEQGVDPAYDYTSLKGGTSSGMHEAQSRFFENIVGRDEAFAAPLLACISRRFPDRFSDVSPHDLWLAENRAEPSLIRTEADELTYPLHVVIRYEIEQLLFAGEAKAADVPGLWADRYRSYLGVDVPDDRHGALQDSHWSTAYFGYFPTYALGSAYGAQLKDRMVEEGMDFPGVLASGDLAPVRAWLASRIWRWGRAKEPADLMCEACGTPFDASHYTRYLSEKFSSIYGL